jgi:uncharacterized protein (TIGR00252 family)
MSTEVGRRAEQVAAAYLRRRGYQVVAQNWRTRWCEIDLIVRKGSCIYFVEVKYRGSTAQGSGLEYITNRKLEQMHFAAEFWLAQHPQSQGDYRLAALEVTGQDYSVTAWLDDV